MITLTIRTDKPDAELGIYDNAEQIAYVTWTAHRQLAETLHQKIQDTLAANKLRLGDLSAIACYKGPGSFTGLRIGLSTANALAYSLQIPIAAASGDGWQLDAVRRLLANESDNVALPEYGAEANITRPKLL